MKIQVDICDEDFEKLKNGKTLELARGLIAGTPIRVVMKRKSGKKSKESEELLILRLLSIANTMVERETFIEVVMKRHKIPKDKIEETLKKLEREGSIYQPRPGYVRTT